MQMASWCEEKRQSSCMIQAKHASGHSSRSRCYCGRITALLLPAPVLTSSWRMLVVAPHWAVQPARVWPALQQQSDERRLDCLDVDSPLHPPPPPLPLPPAVVAASRLHLSAARCCDSFVRVGWSSTTSRTVGSHCPQCRRGTGSRVGRNCEQCAAQSEASLQGGEDDDKQRHGRRWPMEQKSAVQCWSSTAVHGARSRPGACTGPGSPGSSDSWLA